MKRDPNAPVTIYTLADPRTNQVRYVGQAVNPESRLAGHLSAARSGMKRTDKDAWIAELLDLGLRPALNTLARVQQSQANLEERRSIDAYRAAGCSLFNVAVPAPKHPCIVWMDSPIYTALVNYATDHKVTMSDAINQALGAFLSPPRTGPIEVE